MDGMTGPTPDPELKGSCAMPGTLRPPAAPSSQDAMPLRELRGYRRLLVAEEDRVSYWRRVVQARIDLIEDETNASGDVAGLSLARLRHSLGDTATGRSRRVLARISTADPLPELPTLEHFWDEVHDGVDGAAELRTAEQQLTAYRRVLHELIDQVTARLVERYREEPRAALELLP